MVECRAVNSEVAGSRPAITAKNTGEVSEWSMVRVC